MRRVLSISGVLVAGLVIAALVGNDSHYGLRYLAWRHLRVGDWHYGSRFLNADPAFRESFVGKPRSTLLKWFPDLEPGTARPDLCPSPPEYRDLLQSQREGEWISNTPWLVVYDGQRIKGIVMPKGC
jgi:hypothetical protein